MVGKSSLCNLLSGRLSSLSRIHHEGLSLRPRAVSDHGLWLVRRQVFRVPELRLDMLWRSLSPVDDPPTRPPLDALDMHR